MWWSSLFTDMRPSDFFNFSFLPKYGVAFVRGIEYTLLLAVVSVLLAVIPALLLAMMRLSKVKPVKWFAGAYIAVFRSTPMLVQLSIIYFGLFYAISLPRISLFGFVDISRFVPGVVALALNSSAYVAEIFRAGILAVDKGQTEAARSLGLSSWQSMRLVVLPQAIKNVLPALANEVVTMVKESSICSMLGMAEIMFAAKTIAGSTGISLAPYTLAAVLVDIHAGALCAGSYHLFLHQLSRLQSHRGHRKENAPWRQAVKSSSPCSIWSRSTTTALSTR